MAIKVAINGFGRIGRLVLRALHEQNRDDLQVVAINDLGTVAANAHLLKYDSVHGRFKDAISTGSDWMDVGRGKMKVVAERDPARLPWKDLGVDVALECTGLFTTRATAGKHLEAGAKRVLVSAPADEVDITMVMGVNSDQVNASHRVLSNGSCTTNCLAPVAYVLNEGVGIVHGFMTTVHSYTGDQNTVDTLHKDMRRARAAAINMIPTSTGAAKALGLVIPALNGKLDGTSIRVPTPDVSLIDFKFSASRDTSKDEINALMEKASKSNRFRGILAVTKDENVSSDFIHDSHSATFDLTQTNVTEKHFCRVMAWYDNEWGFSNRMVDTACAMAKLG
jgi:glyceraldehyde 3-phosphate dehydrogenase